VLVDRGSASASEVVSGAWQDQDRATLVGDRTFGKNTVQQTFPLDDGGALKLTIARWVTPDGRDFGEVGLAPDVVLELPSDLDEPREVAGRVLAAVDDD
jgi:carboxyl-terminal processing protease